MKADMNFFLNPANHLFTLARSGRRLPHMILAIVLSFVFILAAQLGGGIPALLLIIAFSMIGQPGAAPTTPNQLSSLIDTPLEQAVLLVLAFAPLFIILWLWLALFEKRPLWTIGLERRGAVPNYLRGFLVGVVMFVVAIGLTGALGYIAFEEGDPQRQGLAALGGVLLILVGWFVQGPAEEALTRGWLLPVIGARYKPIWGIVISSISFAVYHSLNPNLNPIAVLNLFLFGIFTAFYALYEGGLWGVFGLHTAWNWAQGNLFGFEVSGTLPAGSTLFNFMEVGPDVITGGPFGPEGGLAVTVVLVLSGGVVWWLSLRREKGG